MDIISLQSELVNGNCIESSDLNPTEPESNGKEWFRTWPENKRVKDLTLDDNCPPIANNNYQKKTRQTIPLDQLLQSMPIAYSPVTKQLHVVAKVIMLRKYVFFTKKNLTHSRRLVRSLLKSKARRNRLTTAKAALQCRPSQTSVE
jgi:hypothetical protein